MVSNSFKMSVESPMWWSPYPSWPNSGIRVWFDFVEDRQLDLMSHPAIGCENSYLWGRILDVSVSGWSLPINGWNIEFIRKIIHLFNSLKFWIEMWRFPLLWFWNINPIDVSDSFGQFDSFLCNKLGDQFEKEKWYEEKNILS